VTRAIAVPVEDLRLFQRIIAREASILFDSFAEPGRRKLADSTPRYVYSEYAEMRGALKKLDAWLRAEGKASP
jgi:hypothetical protein